MLQRLLKQKYNYFQVDIVWGPFHGELTDISISVDETNDGYTIMSGGYIPGNNYGDDVGFDEFVRPIECSDSGLDSLAYSIFNPNIPPNGEYSDTTVITFCVHGVNDPPYLFDISNRTFNEDNIFEIPIRKTSQSFDSIIDSDEITIFDPDSLFNNINVLYTTPDDDDIELSVNNNRLYISPENNVNGTYQITITETGPLGTKERMKINIQKEHDPEIPIKSRSTAPAAAI